MTIIVTVKNDEKTIIGADKRLLENDIIVSENASKILIKELLISSYNHVEYEYFLIAFSGLYSLFELLETFTVPAKEPRETFLEYLYKTLTPKLNSHLRDYNFLQQYNNGQNGVDWELIIAYKNELFLIEYTLGVCEIQTPYYATGAPRDIALGSLHTYYHDHPRPVEIFMVKKAIEACAAHHISCNNNMELYSIHKTGEIKQIK